MAFIHASGKRKSKLVPGARSREQLASLCSKRAAAKDRGTCDGGYGVQMASYLRAHVWSVEYGVLAQQYFCVVLCAQGD